MAHQMQSQGGQRPRAQQDYPLGSLHPEIEDGSPHHMGRWLLLLWSSHEKNEAEKASLHLQHLACKPSPPASLCNGEWSASPTVSTLTQCCLPTQTSSYLPWCSKGMLF